MPKKRTQEEFIKLSIIKHKGIYTYEKVKYINNITKVDIYCKKCKDYFRQIPKDHLNGRGCKDCGALKSIKSRTLTKKCFIEKSNKKHLNIYDYSVVKYKNNRTHVKIICIIHGVFKQTPDHHMSGIGCPMCGSNLSIGEKIIRKLLTDKKIIFYEQYKFKNQLGNIKKCKYDFYIPEKNMIIEFHGIQHFKYNLFFHKDFFDFLDQCKRDYDKQKFCIDNNIIFIEIHYNHNIEKIIENLF